MKRKLITSILFILLLLSSITIASATDTTAKYNGTNSDNVTYSFKTSENETISGFCLNHSKVRPSIQGYENITYNITNTSNVNNTIKEAIIKYYLNQTKLTLDELQDLIWKIQGRNITNNTKINEMYDSLTGTMEIGDTYTYKNGTYIYTFNFYHALPNDDDTKGIVNVQDLILFTFTQENIPFDNSTTNNSTNNSTTNKVTTKNMTNDVTTPEVGKIDINTQTSNNSADTNEVSANMKTTGIPINLILVILLSLIGFDYYRKR